MVILLFRKWISHQTSDILGLLLRFPFEKIKVIFVFRSQTVRWVLITAKGCAFERLINIYLADWLRHLCTSLLNNEICSSMIFVVCKLWIYVHFIHTNNLSGHFWALSDSMCPEVYLLACMLACTLQGLQTSKARFCWCFSPQKMVKSINYRLSQFDQTRQKINWICQ